MPAINIDAHAHVFKRGSLLQGIYDVDYDATIEDYIAMLDGLDIHYGVLVQPSFLGNDNSYLLEGIERYPDRLKGIVVVPTSTPFEELEKLSAKGAVGVRLNLMHWQDVSFQSAEFQTFLENLKKLDWQVEIHVQCKRLPEIIPQLLEKGVNVVVDHFGKPAPDLNDAGFDYLLSTAKTGKVYVKLSGWYRLAPEFKGQEVAVNATNKLLEHFGPEHLVYGSDWPHLGSEKIVNPALQKKLATESWLRGNGDLIKASEESTLKLFKFK